MCRTPPKRHQSLQYCQPRGRGFRSPSRKPPASYPITIGSAHPARVSSNKEPRGAPRRSSPKKNASAPPPLPARTNASSPKSPSTSIPCANFSSIPSAQQARSNPAICRTSFPYPCSKLRRQRLARESLWFLGWWPSAALPQFLQPSPTVNPSANPSSNSAKKSAESHASPQVRKISRSAQPRTPARWRFHQLPNPSPPRKTISPTRAPPTRETLIPWKIPRHQLLLILPRKRNRKPNPPTHHPIAPARDAKVFDSPA